MSVRAPGVGATSHARFGDVGGVGWRGVVGGVAERSRPC